jgi:hypothetical protein
MVSYIFYPYRPDGDALVFDEADLSNDDAARAYARGVLAEHASAVRVEIWNDNRRVEPAEVSLPVGWLA